MSYSCNALMPLWTKDEINQISIGHSMGLRVAEIQERFAPGRSVKAVKTKLINLGMLRVRPLKYLTDETPLRVDLPENEFEPGDDKLLVALLHYGLRHNSDLGMGRDAFFSRARECGVAA